METIDEDEQELHAELDLLTRASARISEILPRRLRFSEAWGLRRDLALKSVQNQGVSLQPRSTFNATSTEDQRKLKVFVRLRPASVKVSASSNADKVAIRATSNVEVVLHPPQNAKRMLKPLPVEAFSFTKVFPGSTDQLQYYQETTEPLVHDLLSFKAKSSVIMAYGSSGAGKTFTIEGTQEQPGLLPHAVQHIFRELEGTAHKVLISYFEVYNDLVFDLLDPTGAGNSAAALSSQQQPVAAGGGGHGGGAGLGGGRILKHALLQPHESGRRALRIREDGGGRVIIPGLSEVVCATAEQVLDLQRRAARLRHAAATGVNNTSSRSHCVFTIKLLENTNLGQDLVLQPGGKPPQPQQHRRLRTSQLSLVDLAGSERAGRTGNTGERMRESVSINSSLMTLGRCLEVLKSNQAAAPGAAQRVVPYRESKITHLFRDVLHGYGHLVLSVSVSPMALDYEETHHVLRYAALAGSICLAVLPPEQDPPVQGDSLQSHAVTGGTAQAGKEGQAADAQALSERVSELEEELERVCAQLSEAETALAEAEADVRDEIVGEIQDVMHELRSSYESKIQALTISEAEARAELQRVREEHAQCMAVVAQRESESRALEQALHAAQAHAAQLAALLQQHAPHIDIPAMHVPGALSTSQSALVKSKPVNRSLAAYEEPQPQQPAPGLQQQQQEVQLVPAGAQPLDGSAGQKQAANRRAKQHRKCNRKTLLCNNALVQEAGQEQEQLPASEQQQQAGCGSAGLPKQHVAGVQGDDASGAGAAAIPEPSKRRKRKAGVGVEQRDDIDARGDDNMSGSTVAQCTMPTKKRARRAAGRG